MEEDAGSGRGGDAKKVVVKDSLYRPGLGNDVPRLSPENEGNGQESSTASRYNSGSDWAETQPQ